MNYRQLNSRGASGSSGSHANGNSGNVYGAKAASILSKLHSLAANRTDGVTEDDARNCQECLAGLCVLARKPAAKEVVLKSICTLLTNTFRRYRAYPSTLQSACDLVWSLAYHDDATQALFAESGITIAVLECAVHHEGLVSLLKSSFGALSSLCRNQANQNLARKHGVVDLVLRVLDQNPAEDPMLVQYTLDCAASICHAHKDNGNFFLAYDGARHVVKALDNYMSHQGVVRSACIVLVVLRDRAGGPKAVAGTGCIPILVRAIKLHASVPELEHILCALLGQLMREVPNVIPEGFESGAISAVLEAMKVNPGHYFIVEAGCMVLGACGSLIIKRSGSDKSRLGRRRLRARLSDTTNGEDSAAEELERALDGVGWSGIAAVLQSPDAKPGAYVSCMRVLAQFCQISEGRGQSVARLHDLLPRVFSVCGQFSGIHVGQSLSILESLLLSSSVDCLVASAVCWTNSFIAIVATGERDARIDLNTCAAFRPHTKLGGDTQSILRWYRNAGSLTVTDMQKIVLGALSRLKHLETDRTQGLHQKQQRIFVQVYNMFYLLSAWLLTRESRQEIVNLIDRDVTWSELLGLALTWLREARCANELSCFVKVLGEPMLDDALLVIVSTLQFVVCTLLKERQLTLRCMASNGGVTLVLQIQKLVKGLNQVEQIGGHFGRLQTLALDTTAVILRLIGAGALPTMDFSPSESAVTSLLWDLKLLEAADDRSYEDHRAAACGENVASDGVEAAAEEERPSSGRHDEDEASRDGQGRAPEDDSDETKMHGRNGKGSNQEDDDEDGDANDDSDADDSDGDDEGVDDEIVPQLDGADDQGADELVVNDDDEKDQEDTKRRSADRRSSSRKIGHIIMPFGSDQDSERAPAKFVATLPTFIHDLTDDDFEPCIPITQRLNPATAQALSKLGEYQQRRLVYDWRQSLGEGEGRARSSLPMAVPYSCGTEESVQLNEPSILLEGASSIPRTPMAGMQDHYLRFESRFEGGNLLQASRIGPREYDLVIRSDLHTRSHHQWFYFAVSNTHTADMTTSVQYKFNIVNVTKPSSMFTEGMQPVLYSMKDAKDGKGQGWRRVGKNIAYFANSYATPPALSKKSNTAHYYTLTFTMTFPNPEDIYFIAMCYPYTYTQLQDFLGNVCEESAKSKSNICRRSLLCNTLGGLRCDELTITDFSSDPGEVAARPAIVLTARVHPGEVVASHMIEGTIRFLLGDSALACTLRRLYYFKIIPMLNPDGVYHGNSRTSLSGCDLNRAWVAPNPNVFPTIYHTKQMIRRLIAQRKVSLYVDFHGHSRKKNIFLYGVEYKKSAARARDEVVYDMSNPVRAFPKLMSESEYTSDIFSLSDCSYGVSKSHTQAARVVVARELGVRASFTLEASFCGAAHGTLDPRLEEQHFNVEHYRRVGLGLCDALLRMNHAKLYHGLRELCGTAPITRTSAPPTLLEDLLARTVDKPRVVIAPELISASGNRPRVEVTSILHGSSSSGGSVGHKLSTTPLARKANQDRRSPTRKSNNGSSSSLGGGLPGNNIEVGDKTSLAPSIPHFMLARSKTHTRLKPDDAGRSPTIIPGAQSETSSFQWTGPNALSTETSDTTLVRKSSQGRTSKGKKKKSSSHNQGRMLQSVDDEMSNRGSFTSAGNNNLGRRARTANATSSRAGRRLKQQQQPKLQSKLLRGKSSVTQNNDHHLPQQLHMHQATNQPYLLSNANSQRSLRSTVPSTATLGLSLLPAVQNSPTSRN